MDPGFKKIVVKFLPIKMQQAYSEGELTGISGEYSVSLSNGMKR